jgi:4-oxalomesaconate tautomerase
MTLVSDQVAIPCVFMRGGTSKGPFFHLADLPADEATRSAVLLRLMGALEPRRIDGIGGVDNPTNKVAIISRSRQPGVDVDYLFAQICVHKNTVDYSVNCGNMLAGVGPFAIDEGLVAATGAETTVRILNVNTGKRIDATVKTAEGRARYQGEAAIDGVPGTAAPVWLDFRDSAGAKTGRLLPTGAVLDEIDGIPISCVDAAVPMAIARAADFGLTGHEDAETINANQPLLDRIETLRRAAGALMGLGDVSKLEMPKFALVAAPRDGRTEITARYFMPFTCHAAFAVTGAICLAAAAKVPGSVAHAVAEASETGTFTIAHPQGTIAVSVDADIGAEGVVLRSARLLRTARRMFAGEVYVPDWRHGSATAIGQSV